MTPERKTKAVGKRIDLSYIHQPSRLRSARRAAVIVCALLALAWGGWALFARSERIYNPGPVATAHAMYENDCAACHDGGAKGGGKFFMTVSDSACLKCHPAAIHAQKQTTLASMIGGKPTMSSNCTTCHVEHRGHNALVGTSDALCSRCHENLTSNVAGGATALPTNVTAFDSPPAHPTFGRVLRQGNAWVDPTPLKFNHKKHLSDINPKVGDCATCHHLSTTGDRRIMSPVSFEENCKSCHPLTLPNNIADVPHERMEIVRVFAAGLPSVLTQKLAAMSPEEKEKALTITTEKKVGIRMVKETKKVTEAEWVETQMKEMMEKSVANSPTANHPSYAAVQSLDPSVRNAAATELFIAHGMSTSCSYCHTLSGAPAGVAKSPAELLQTLPTGFHPQKTSATTRPVPTDQGRRWFAASRFDHHAHRAMVCADCHDKATNSTQTTDLLLPDIQSCVKCHHAGGQKMSAASNCIACHVYHDRSRELTAGP